MFVIKQADMQPDQSQELTTIAYVESETMAIQIRDTLQLHLGRVKTNFEIHTITEPSMILDAEDLYLVFEALNIAAAGDTLMKEPLQELLDRVLEKAPQD